MRRWPFGALLTCLALLAGGAVACADEQPDSLLRELTATGTGREMYPSFDPGVHHYAVGCGEQGALTLSLSTADADTRVDVNEVEYTNSDAVVELTGLTADGDVVIELGDGERSATYTVHCLPDDFPTITTRKTEEASDFLILGNAGRDYIAIFDTNGVPRFHRGAERSTNFKYHPDGRYPYSFFLRLDRIPNFSDRNLMTKEAVVLGEDFSVRDVVQTVPPLTHTDHHDFIIKPNGNYVLLSYEPSRRDLSAVLDADGNPYSVSEGTEDSVIQEITPQGEQVFLWNSWDHLAVVEDCTQHYFPDDYAHANSLQAVDGDIIASFRGCSQVLRIDGVSGEIIWMLGKSNRSDADWIASGAPAPLKIVGDPHGEFCGQHSARLLPNGNLILFDNGDHCLEDPATGMTERANGTFSRVVEYSLDLETGQATFQRHHSLHGTFDRLAQRLGHVELMDNGNWLISWGDSPADPAPALHPDESITEVDPETGRELFSLVIADDDGNILTTRAFPLPPDALERRPAVP